MPFIRLQKFSSVLLLRGPTPLPRMAFIMNRCFLYICWNSSCFFSYSTLRLCVTLTFWILNQPCIPETNSTYPDIFLFIYSWIWPVSILWMMFASKHTSDTGRWFVSCGFGIRVMSTSLNMLGSVSSVSYESLCKANMASSLDVWRTHQGSFLILNSISFIR